MKIFPVLCGVIAAGAITLALYQIGCAIYALGCYRKFNQLVDAVAERFNMEDPDKAADSVIDLSCFLVIAVVVVIAAL